VEDARPSDYCTLKWRVTNQTQAPWPAAVHLALMFSQPVALIDNQPLNTILQAGESQEITVNIFIPKDIKEPYQVVMFRLKTGNSYLG